MSKEKHTYNKNELKISEDSIPDFSKLKKNNPFEVPENYFDSLPLIISNKIDFNRNRHSLSISRLFSLNPKFSVAIVSSAFVILMTVFLLTKSSQEFDSLSEITFEDVLLEYPELIENMDESIFYESLLVETEVDYFGDFETNFDMDTSLSDEDIFNYLTEEDIDSELIYNL